MLISLLFLGQESISKNKHSSNTDEHKVVSKCQQSLLNAVAVFFSCTKSAMMLFMSVSRVVPRTHDPNIG